MEGGKVSTAIPKASPPTKQKLQRLSPGVYRNAAGGLVGSKGQALPGGQPTGAQAPSNPYAGANLLNDQQRREHGIDARDPNRYWMTPDGHVAGTLIGWEGMGRPKPQAPSAQAPAAPNDQAILDLLRRLSR